MNYTLSIILLLLLFPVILQSEALIISEEEEIEAQPLFIDSIESKLFEDEFPGIDSVYSISPAQSLQKTLYADRQYRKGGFYTATGITVMSGGFMAALGGGFMSAIFDIAGDIDELPSEQQAHYESRDQMKRVATIGAYSMIPGFLLFVKGRSDILDAEKRILFEPFFDPYEKTSGVTMTVEFGE